MDLRPGCVVRQVVHVITGVVASNGIRWNPGHEKFEVLVQYLDAEKQLQERWFLENEVSMVRPPPDAGADTTQTQTISTAEIGNVTDVLSAGVEGSKQ